jgi:putative membrane protein
MRSTLIALILIGAASTAVADGTDEQFLVKAMQASMLEVQLGKLAQKNAQSTGVYALGERLARDHARIGKMLVNLSQEKGIAVPVLDGSSREVVDTLADKRGADFDAAYTVQMVSTHAKAVALFTAVAESNDSELSLFAKRVLPMLREDGRLAGSYEKMSASAVHPVANAQ